MITTRSKEAGPHGFSGAGAATDAHSRRNAGVMETRAMRTAAAAMRLEALSKSAARVFDKAQRLTTTLDRLTIVHTRRPQPHSDADAGAVNDAGGAARQTARKHGRTYDLRQRPRFIGEDALGSLKRAVNRYAAALKLHRIARTADPRLEGPTHDAAASSIGAREGRTVSDGSSGIDRFRAATQTVRDLTHSIYNALALSGRSSRNAILRAAETPTRRDGAGLVQAPRELNGLLHMRHPDAGERARAWFGAGRGGRITHPPSGVAQRRPIRAAAALANRRWTRADRFPARPRPAPRAGALPSIDALTTAASVSTAVRRLMPRASALPAPLAPRSAAAAHTGASRTGPALSAPAVSLAAERLAHPATANASTASAPFGRAADPQTTAAFRGAGAALKQSLTLNYSPTIIIRDGDVAADLDRRVIDALSEHGHDLLQTLSRELSRRSRTRF